MELLNHFNKTIDDFYDMVGALDLVDGNLTDLGFNVDIALNSIAEVVYAVAGIWTLNSEVLIKLRAIGQTWSKWCDNCKTRLQSWCKSLILVHEFFDFELTYEDLAVFLAKYSLASLYDLGEDFLKYQTNFLACRLFEQTVMPERPASLPADESDGCIFHKQYRRQFHKMWRHNRRLQFAYSLIQFKRGCLPVSELMQIKAIAKHATTLGTKPTNKLSRSLAEEIRRTVREVLGKGNLIEMEGLLAPSTSAHFENTRVGFGAAPIVSEQCQTICENHTNCNFSLFDCSCHKWLIYEKEGFELMEHFDLGPQPSPDLKVELLSSAVLSGKSLNTCEVHSVLEPFKVRMITAGNSETGYLGRYLQKRIHARVGKHPVFEFTHQPASLDSLRDDIGDLAPGEVLVSADYEAATDNLHPYATKVAWEACSGWYAQSKTDFRTINSLGQSMLCGQILNYRKSINKILGDEQFPLVGPWNFSAYEKLTLLGLTDSVVQQRGQLMGCILSFFLLCMINATSVRIAFEKVHRMKFSLRDLPLKINGDDALFRATPAVVEEWSKIATTLGLKPSLGKNFVSRDFAMINSELYEYMDWRFGMKIPKCYTPYMNLGLLMGQGRVQEDTRCTIKFINGSENSEPVGARSRYLIKGWSLKRQKRLISLFTELNRDKLETTSRGWGIPESLGGLGIPHVTNHSVKSLVVAAYLDRLDPESYSDWMSKISGTDLNPPPFVQEAMNLNHRILRLCSESKWGDPLEKSTNELPLLTGVTWRTTSYNYVKKERYKNSSEHFYNCLYHKAVRSGVAAKTHEQIQSYVGKVKYFPTTESVRQQMLNWIPKIRVQYMPEN